MAKFASDSDLTRYTNNLFTNANILKRNTTYSADAIVNKGQVVLKCTTAGTTDTIALNLSSVSVGDTLTDGTVEWKVISITGYDITIGGSGDVVVANWLASTEYVLGQLVFYGGKLYKCTTAHTSSSTFTQANWTPVNDTLDDWQGSKEYYVNQLVRYNGKVYRCKEQHVSDINEPPGEGTSQKIVNESDSVVYLIYYTTDTLPVYGTVIDLGDIYRLTRIASYYNGGGSGFEIDLDVEVSLDGISYSVDSSVHINASVNKDFDLQLSSKARYIRLVVANAITPGYTQALNVTNLAIFGFSDKWEVIVEDSTRLVYWTSSTKYEIDDIAVYNNALYRCTSPHTSTSTFDSTKFTQIGGSGGGGTTISDWATGTTYSVGDLVIYDNNIYQCITAHIATSTFDATKWEEISASENGISEWQASTEYEVGDVLIYNDCIYRCDTAHTSTSTFDDTKFTQLTYEPEEDTDLIEDIFGGAGV